MKGLLILTFALALALSLAPSLSGQAGSPTPTATNHPPSGWPECDGSQPTYDQAACIARADRHNQPHDPPPLERLPENEAEALQFYAWAREEVRLSHCTSVWVAGWHLPEDYLATCLDPTPTPTEILPTEPATEEATETVVATVQVGLTPSFPGTSTPHQPTPFAATQTPQPTNLDPAPEPGAARLYLPLIGN